MSVGQYGGLTRHDMTTRCLLRPAAGSVSPIDAYHARPPNEVVCFKAEQTTVYCLAVRHRSVGRHQTVTVHRVNTLFDLVPPWRRQQRRPLCLSHAPYTAAGAVTRDGVAVAAGCGGYWLRRWRLLPNGGFKLQLSIINRLIHNRLSIMEKIRK